MITQNATAVLPLNLLGWLLWRLARTMRITISTEERDGWLLVTAVGEGSPHIVRALERFLATYDEARFRADLDVSRFLFKHEDDEP